MKRCGPCLLDDQSPADLTEYFHLKIPTLVTVQLFGSTKLAEHLAHRSFSHGGSTLVRYGICLWPLGEIVHGDQDVPVPPFSHRKRRTSTPSRSMGVPNWYCFRRALSWRPQNGPPLQNHGPSVAPLFTAVWVPTTEGYCAALPEPASADKGPHRGSGC
ncbi:hypothetical protein GOODEAATRI_018614 [Goodea atripinnis]|uniref:Uncharacterized protein n=1 Tax=Goodea atripinnis TaxID=208336 RepID=A0ABV0NX27_9TELE